MAAAFRPAGIDDAPRLAELGRRSFVETFGHLYTPENLAAFLANHDASRWREDLADPDHAIILAEEDGEAAGYAQLGPVTLVTPPERLPAIELRRLYLLKPWHGTGLAAAMMDWAVAEARRRQARDLYLSVFIDNHRARRFYDRYGFVEIGTYDFMVGDHADTDLIMRLRLEE
ncbi:MAG: GNAT family N-acetyltransferase [Allosphingosinicella sp.]|uniref:GNAT family N-acetyltransferase n=1 Tax=Allosphingosinicella sp. TaxID=2823234 RepID=UPI0039478350